MQRSLYFTFFISKLSELIHKMKPLINKQLYKFTQDKLQKHGQGGQIKNSALAIKLHEDYSFGQLDLNNKQLFNF